MPAAGSPTRTLVSELGDPLETVPGADALHRRLVVATAAGPAPSSVTVVDETPGVTGGPTPADTVIGIGAIVALPAVPANTRRRTVQNTGPTGSALRVREVGAGAGRGFILPRFGFKEFGTAGGAIFALEVEDVSAAVFGVGVATTANVIDERD